MDCMKIPRTSNQAIRGFSLVEMLVAMAISLIVLSGIISVFAGNKRNSEMNSAMANLQESARFAINTIAADIRLSGYQGCIDVNTLSAKSQTTNAPLVGDQLNSTATTGAMVQADGTWRPASPVDYTPPTANPAIPGTHTLMLQFGHAAQQVGLSGQMNLGGVPSLSGPLALNTPIPDLDIDDFVIVSNCETGDLFQVTGLSAANTLVAHAAGRNVSGNLQQAYGNLRTIGQTTAMKFHSNIYYVGDTGLQNEDGSSVTALFQQGLPYDNTNPPTELIQGVENLRVTFGIRGRQDTLRYVTPDDSNFNPRQVESVQIGLLMSSWDSIADQDDDSTYMLAGQQISPASATGAGTLSTHPADKRFRLAFNTTIKVRNRRRP